MEIPGPSGAAAMVNWKPLGNLKWQKAFTKSWFATSLLINHIKKRQSPSVYCSASLALLNRTQWSGVCFNPWFRLCQCPLDWRASLKIHTEGTYKPKCQLDTVILIKNKLQNPEEVEFFTILQLEVTDFFLVLKK